MHDDGEYLQEINQQPMWKEKLIFLLFSDNNAGYGNRFHTKYLPLPSNGCHGNIFHEV